MIYFDTCNTPIGDFFIGIENNHIVSFSKILPKGIKKETTLTKEVKQQISSYFDGKLQHFNLPISLQGSDFQKIVWTHIKTIKYGNLQSYKEIAHSINHPFSYRAIGNACNKNPLYIIIPCHRVVSSRNIGGYALGLQNKKFLLKLEGCNF